MMKLKLKHWITAILTLAMVVSGIIYIPWQAVSIWFKPLPDTVQEQLDQAISVGLDGVIVYIDEGGKAPALYASGWKDRDTKQPADPHAFFKIASISKLYIAVAATKLVHEGRLSLDKSLASYLPHLSHRIANAQQITLAMMIRHRSGIPNFTDSPDYPWAHPPKTNTETLELVLDQPADFEPDSRYAYSNTNYLLIGAILDTVLGYDHQQYIRETILQPLHLNHTFGLLADVPNGEVMGGYFVGYDQDIKNNDFINPGGSMVATAEDVGVFLRALNDGSLFNDEEEAVYSSLYRYEHTGLLPGYQSFARYHEELDAVVVMFVNTSGGDAWTISEMVYDRIIKIMKK